MLYNLYSTDINDSRISQFVFVSAIKICESFAKSTINLYATFSLIRTGEVFGLCFPCNFVVNS